MLQSISSVFVVYRRKTLTGSLDPTHANGTDKPCMDRQTLVKILPWPNFVAAGNKKWLQEILQEKVDHAC